ncbi:unnamed protein product [Hyaloperonospora brassicae]|uniref:Uncharacterized protein n=1 Tax=Hyaloperonospora brassicae TaxID=162125 RepID=A0AAV0T8U4_HYABA|nr:unnamed protein product [Hyaloperonospora brassicae]
MDDWKASGFKGVFKNDEELTRLSYAVIAQGRSGSSYKSGYDALVTRFELKDFAVMFKMIAKHGNADADKFGKDFLRKIISAWERQKKNKGIVPDALRGEYADVVAKLSKVV